MRTLQNCCSAVLLALSAFPATATLIVDTGAGVNGQPWAFEPAQYFAGEFAVGSWQAIQSVEGYYANIEAPPGSVTIRLHRDEGNIPGEVLFSRTHGLPGASGLDWYGVFGLDWVIAPGIYWVSFEPDGGIKGIHPGKAPNPMDEYAQHSGGGWLDWGPNYFDYLDVGVRIDATPATAVPAPATLFLLGAGLAGLGVMRRTAPGAESLTCQREALPTVFANVVSSLPSTLNR